jgi:hypothetical protein
LRRVTQASFDFGAQPPDDAPPSSPQRGERVWIARGPRAAEELLLGEIAREAEAARAVPRLLARPVRVIVPSRSLREHVAARLAQRHGGLAGVVVQTLRGFAREVLRRAGHEEACRGGDLLLPVLVRRHAQEYEPLREVLGALDEGYSPVVESVRDLLDAGFDEHTASSDALDALEDDAPVRRARAIAALALRARVELASRSLAAPGALFARATEALERDPSLAHARALLVHGYADLTGLQLGLVKQLVAGPEGRLVLDHPPDPTGGGGVGAFTQRLREGLGAPPLPKEPAVLPPPPALLRSPGAQAEVREVAERIRALLAGANPPEPESIGIVARDLRPYRLALATHLRRLGIPFTGGPGFVDPAGRRLRALLALIDETARVSADRWLDAADLRAGDHLELADLRLALHSMGRGRLGEVAALDVDEALRGEDRYWLPVRTRLASDEAAEEGEPAESVAEDAPLAAGQRGARRATRRSVSRVSLGWARDDAGAALAACADLEHRATLAEQLAALRQLTTRALRWRRETPGRALLDAALAQLARELPADLALRAHELHLLLERALRDVGVAALGGSGGGVQVLSATAARARTFSHLFVLGLERDAFPRVVTEDALLPDRLRRELAVVLPDIPIKARGYAEERFLFAQLCAAAERVTLSWQETSDDGKERPASPLVQHLRIAHGLKEAAPSAPLVFAERSSPRPAHEHALVAGLSGDRAAAAEATALALAPLLGAGARAAAEARSASLAFRDDFEPPRLLGPHLGQIGPALAGVRALSVTRVEAIGRCPWRAFLEKLLGLEPPPDALAALPELSPLLVGNAVHGALEQIARRAGVGAHRTLAEALAEPPRDVPWPEPGELAEIAAVAARSAAVDQGILLPGFAELLAHRARALLERARSLDWRAGVRPGVRGVEVECEVSVAVAGEEPLAVGCRADRVDQWGERLVLTDYKTGKPISDKAREDTRRGALRAAIEEGTKLQVVAYARAAGGPATGRYLFLRPDVADAHAEVSVSGEADLAEVAAFEASVERAIRAWRRGELTPALIEDDAESEGRSCKFCEVSEACWKDDPGAKRRLAAWREAQRARAPEAPR